VLSEGVDVIPEVMVTSCSYSRAQRKVILGLSNGKSVSISHSMHALSVNSMVCDLSCESISVVTVLLSYLHREP